MRRLGFLLLACSLAGCDANPAAGDADHAAGEADDARAWQGTWKLVSCVANGEPQTADLEWIVSGDHYNIRHDGKTGSDPYPFRLDARQKRIDVNHHDTPKGTYGGRLKGIYEIRGDSLKVCYDLKGQRYPRSFDAGHGSGQVLYQFRRGASRP